MALYNWNWNTIVILLGIQVFHLEVCVSGVTDSPSDIIELDLSFKPHPNLTEGMFSNYTNLKILRLSATGISEIEDGSFSGLPSLERLEMYKNRLTILKNATFGNLSNLKVLYIAENALSTVESHTFSGLESLEELYLRGNYLTVLTDSLFSNLNNLVKLDLGYNDIYRIEANTFFQLHALETLLLQRNNLTTEVLKGRLFRSLSNLKDLKLQQNMISNLEAEMFSGLDSLEFLYLGENKLKVLTNGLFEHLASLSDGLFINDNEIIEIETGAFAGLKALTSLWLRGNRLTKLKSGTFQDLTSLYTLILVNNNISEIESGTFDGLESLQIFLDNNNLKSISRDILKNIRTLWSLGLNGNGLSEIVPGTFSDHQTLYNLGLGANKLTHLKNGIFEKLTELDGLILSDNNLTEIEADVFKDLTSLTYLNISNSQLKELPPGICEYMPQLRTINLTLNYITGIPSNITDEFGITDAAALKHLICLPPKITVIQAIVQNETILILCSAINYPVPSVVWSVGGFSPNVEQTEGRTSTMMTSIYVTGDEIYECNATNTYGFDSATVTITANADHTNITTIYSNGTSWHDSFIHEQVVSSTITEYDTSTYSNPTATRVLHTSPTFDQKEFTTKGEPEITDIGTSRGPVTELNTDSKFNGLNSTTTSIFQGKPEKPAENHSLVLGLGIGIPAAVLFLIILLCIILTKKRNIKQYNFELN
ncbi:unnamed protein product [Owenia fusiformis]|uniref:Ig-like domain-containing protein n=1 Tax=Owenia fusiformis TaxID=6347 RepID=A0A8S4PER0_OWEFU|nr:unnamed protein product [Owenia fusiformis]